MQKFIDILRPPPVINYTISFIFINGKTLDIVFNKTVVMKKKLITIIDITGKKHVFRKAFIKSFTFSF